jgi:hypothetical protein
LAMTVLAVSSKWQALPLWPAFSNSECRPMDVVWSPGLSFRAAASLFALSAATYCLPQAVFCLLMCCLQACTCGATCRSRPPCFATTTAVSLVHHRCCVMCPGMVCAMLSWCGARQRSITATVFSA